MIKRIRSFIKKFPRETSALCAAFAFALAGDWIYGGVNGAKTSLVGTVMAGASSLFFAIFTIMVLFYLVSKVFFSKGFFNWIEDTKKGAKKK